MAETECACSRCALQAPQTAPPLSRRSAQLVIRLTPELLARLRARAERDQRSVADVARLAIDAALAGEATPLSTEFAAEAP